MWGASKMNQIEQRGNIQPIAKVHKDLGISTFEEEQYGRAFAHFSLALTLEPTLTTELQDLYIACLYAWCDKLESEGKLNELFLCYEQAISLYGTNVDIHFSLANQLNRLGHVKEAAKFYKKCLLLDSNHLPSYHNWLSASNKLVERWHFRMLNDKVRNNAYKRAIAKKIAEGHKEVLDIGTGTGLLSLFGTKNGARQVYACDHSPTMVEIASEVIEETGCSDGVKVIGKTSTELTIPNDLPNRVSLVVTETMDAGVFGENLLETLIHAWDNLLVSNAKEEIVKSSPPGCCIPQAVTIYAVAIQSAYLAKKYRHSKNSSESASVSLVDYFAVLDEPYDTEDLHRLSSCVCYLSKPVQIVSVDLNNPEELSQLYNKDEEKSFVIKSSCCGRVDAIACFFKVHLDEDTVITSSPLEAENVASCWEQAIFPAPKPIYISADEELSLSVNCFKGKVSVRLSDNKVIEPEKITQPNLLSQDNIRLLNDSELLGTLKEVAAELSSMCCPSDSKVSVLDLSSLPILSLLLADKLLKSKNIKSDLVYYKEDETVQSFVEVFTQENRITPLDSKPFFAEDLYSYFLEHENTYDFIIVNNLVMADGALNDRVFLVLPLVRKYLKSNGMIVPEKITCMGQLINCDWLSKVSSVVPDPENEIFGIASIINKFQVPVHYSLNLETMEYNELSHEFQLFCIDLNEANNEKLQSNISISVTRTGLLSGTTVWFVAHFLQEKPLFVSTKSSESSVDQFASLITPPSHVTEGTSVTVQAAFQDGLLKISMNP